MKCPMCGQKSVTTVDTRNEDDCIIRRKHCLNKECDYRWSTIEIDTSQWYSALQIQEHRKQRGRPRKND